MNKAAERFYLDRFKEHFSGFPEGEIIPGESPDFLVKKAIKTVGIEVTEFHLDSSTNALCQERISLRERVRVQAETFCNAKNLSSVWVTIHFDQNFHCKVSEIEKLAVKLADIVEPFQADPSDKVVFNCDEIEIAYVTLMTVRKVPIPKSHWSAPNARFLPELDFAHIQKILNKKSNRCGEYRKTCSEIWLMIVMDRFNPSSFALIPETVEPACYPHQFDFAFLYVHCYTQNGPLILPLGFRPGLLESHQGTNSSGNRDEGCE